MQKGKPKKKIHPSKKQRKPGLEVKMTAQPPKFDTSVTDPGKKRGGKVALITGGDSGIGRAVAIEDISSEQLIETFSINVYPMFYLVKAAMKHLKAGSSIINTGSVTAYRGSRHFIDYSATKGAIISFTRALSASLV